ncbi:MAG: energy transducer TonB [Candidatus Acidoferrales bacterium]
MTKKDDKASTRYWGAERILFPDEPLELGSAGEPVPVDMDFDFLAAGVRRRRAPGEPEEAIPVDRKLEFLMKPPADAAPRRARSTTVALLVHVGLVGAALLLPLMYMETLELHSLDRTWLATPPPPPPPAPPPPAVGQRAPARRPPAVRVPLEANLTLPTAIPKEIPRGEELGEVEVAGLPLADLGVEGGVPGGVPGGQVGGVLGGVLGGVPSATPPPARPAGPPKPVRVGGVVQAPRLLYHIKPSFPVIARQARIEGDVVLRAIIDVHGRVTHMEVVSGHPLLVRAATQAVQQWRYEPTYLNGEPVPLILEVTVTFSLG